MAPSTTTTRSFSLATNKNRMPSDLESGGMPLNYLPRLSTETQRRNGFIQSSATDPTTRIREDLDSGNYICAICTDNITKNGDVLQNVYHCRGCYNVFHLRCIKSWARQKLGLNPLSSTTWPCPICKCERAGVPKVACWCGKSKTSIECAATCAVAGNCAHGKLKKCIKDCHPGPCEYSCDSSCDNLPVLGVNYQPTAWDKIRRRYKTAPLIAKKSIVNTGSLLLITVIVTQIYLHFYARWNTMPYHYPEYEKKYNWEVDIATGIIGFFLTGYLALMSMRVTGSLYEVWCHIMDPSALIANPPRKTFPTTVVGHFLTLTGLFSTISIFMALIIGPHNMWDSQMDSSCRGFGLKVSMSGEDSRNSLEITTLHYDNVYPRFAYFAPHFAPILRDTSIPFQYYHRLSGKSFNNTPIAVDVDPSNRLWRLYNLNDTDSQNMFLAIGHNTTNRHFTPSVPEFSPIFETLVANGTFTDTSRENKHMHIPELNLSISNHFLYRDSNWQKPFLRVFNTTDLSTADTQKLLDTEWSTSRDTERMVMRTRKTYSSRPASVLNMCVREADWFGHTSDPRWRFLTGVKEELYVPLAILQALRTEKEIVRWW